MSIQSYRSMQKFIARNLLVVIPNAVTLITSIRSGKAETGGGRYLQVGWDSAEPTSDANGAGKSGRCVSLGVCTLVK